MLIREIRADHYRIPLPVALSDSTHGTITHFELITVRLRDSDGAEGVGYTYTVGAGGAAVHALIENLRQVLLGADAEQIEANLNKGVLTASPPKKSAVLEKKIDVKTAV